MDFLQLNTRLIDLEQTKLVLSQFQDALEPMESVLPKVFSVKYKFFPSLSLDDAIISFTFTRKLRTLVTSTQMMLTS